MTVTLEGARGAFVATVLAGASLHPDAVRMGMQMTDGQLAGALAIAAEWTGRCAGERFSIRQRGSKGQRHSRPEEPAPDDASDDLYVDLDAVSAAIIVAALVAEME